MSSEPVSTSKALPSRFRKAFVAAFVVWNILIAIAVIAEAVIADRPNVTGTSETIVMTILIWAWIIGNGVIIAMMLMLRRRNRQRQPLPGV